MPAFLKRQQCQDILIKVSFYYQHNILYVRYAAISNAVPKVQ
jgi:hypothetical protein